MINELVFNTRYNLEAIICLQEVLYQQLVDILNGLNDTFGEKSWAYIGVGREDGHQAGEYSPIFYRADVWKVECQGTTWLSKTPNKPSKDWDAASTRILTYAILMHKSSQRQVLVLNTHLDDQGSVSRYEAAKIILHKIDEVSTTHSTSELKHLPVILAGDFNSEPNQEAYQVITSRKSRLEDLAILISPKSRYGNETTFTGFGHEEEPPKRIDFIFLSNSIVQRYENHQSGWKTKGYAILNNRFEDGIYCSDHRAVIGDVELI